jgi:hypothetical protein
MAPSQRNVLDRATTDLINACGRAFGYDGLLPDGGTDAPLDPMARRYGVVDLTTARRYGYQAPPELSAGHAPGSAPSQGPMSQAEAWVLAGDGTDTGGPPVGGHVPSTLNGEKIPPGGCMGQTYRKLGIDSVVNQGLDLVRNISDSAFAQMLADSRVKAVFTKWSACMAIKGFKYRDVFDPINNGGFGSSGVPTPGEIDTAVADVQCKQESNVVGVMFSVESAYENALIQKNYERLTDAKTHFDVAVRNAAAALATQN